MSRSSDTCQLGICLLVLFLWGTRAAQAEPATPPLAPIEAPRGVALATIDLGAEFPSMKGYVLTQNLETVPPGTGRHWHTHRSQPEIIHVLSGVLTEARNGSPPAQYGPGSTLANPTGTYHAWANLGSTQVVFLATVIKAAH